MTKIKKYIWFFLLLFLIFETANAQTWNIGTPNAADVTATLSNDTLIVSGTGAMQNFTGGTAPWHIARGAIRILVINNGITSIGNCAFVDCSYSIGDLIIPNSVTLIGDSAFHFCYGFTGLIISNSVTSIGNSAFYFCAGLTGDLTIPNSVTSIGSSAFSNCRGLTGSLTISNSVTSIGNGAFYNCSGLTGSLTIPNSVTSIGSSAFQGCSGLTGSLTIPNSVTSIGSSAFYNCSGLTGSLTISNSVTLIRSTVFYNCRGLTGALTIPNSVISIEVSAFSNCRGLTGPLTISNSVTSIGISAFYNCSGLTGTLTIPNSVTSIGSNAFYNCSGFTSVKNLKSIPQVIGSNVFDSVPIHNLTLYVPCGSLIAYQAASVWRNFGTIIEMCIPIPVVSNTQANFSCPGQVTVTYDLNTACTTDVVLYYSHNKRDWLPATTVNGALTAQITGTGKTIIWNNYADNVRFGKFYFKVVPKANCECVMINDVCWAICNADMPGTFAPTPESTGMFYQWNKKIGWSSTNPRVNSNGGTVWDSSFPTGNTWEVANDPCPAGFCMPTSAEINSLLNTTYVTSQWTTLNGINGRRFTDRATGNTVFLPAAGYRYNNGGLLREVGTYGYHWSSTEQASNGAYGLLLSSGNVSLGASYKTDAFAVRCVKE